MTDKHDAPSTEDIREMLNGAIDILNNSEDIAEKEPVMFAWALAQCASASALGQIAGTLSELLAMAKAENEVGLAQDFDRQGGYVTASFAQE